MNCAQDCNELDEVCVQLLLALVSCIRRHQQHKRISSCVSQFCGGLPTAFHRNFARHCCWHWNFQLSTSGFHCELEFFVVWFNEEYSSQFSGIVELWFLDSPSLFCFLFRCIGHKFPHIWPYTIRTRGCLFPCKSPPGRVYPSGGLSFKKMNLVKPVHASDNSLSPSTFQ